MSKNIIRRREMFHVEHKRILQEWVLRNEIDIPGEKAGKLLSYAYLLHEMNQHFNLTGFKNAEDIFERLVLDSLLPLKKYSVPHGTLYADIGSGAGIPGIPLGIMMPEVNGLLIESHRKRSKFIGTCIEKLGLANLRVYDGRVEDAARETQYRESCQTVFSRAFGPVYIVIELAMPLVRTGGYLYIYSTISPLDVDDVTIRHARQLGGEIELREGESDAASGLKFNKVNHVEDLYPRRYPVIKREAGRLDVQ
jgi:16S rRNA (guanine527-N7)-methyltransferase